jgi:hypothetical protein
MGEFRAHGANRFCTIYFDMTNTWHQSGDLRTATGNRDFLTGFDCLDKPG